jgi:serine/threonine protein kinase
MWLAGQRRASIEGINLLPQENTYLKGNPLVVARGQAQAFYLHDETRRVWILKKFLPGRNPNAQYIQAVQSLIPRHPGFESGYQRKVLSQASVAGSKLPSPDFPAWIENTILMPRVIGSDWAYIADKVRDGTIHLTPEQRLLMCRNLSEKIGVLESSGLSHRDLSSTNVFIDTNTWTVHLIDWDSIYHSSLTMPPNTTFGTRGYIAPFVRVEGMEDAQTTWMGRADRFSLGLLNIEFLSVERNSPLTGDGGIFDQDEIYNRGGSGIKKIVGRLQLDFPHALGLFDGVLRAGYFDECPSPDEWQSLGAGVTAPSLKEVYDPQPDFLKFIQQIQKAPPKIERPAPRLSDFEVPDLSEPHVPAAKDDGPRAPRLAELEQLDWGTLSPRALPESVTSPAALAPGPAAPSLTDIEDPFPVAKPEGRE